MLQYQEQIVEFQQLQSTNRVEEGLNYQLELKNWTLPSPNDKNKIVQATTKI